VTGLALCVPSSSRVGKHGQHHDCLLSMLLFLVTIIIISIIIVISNILYLPLFLLLPFSLLLLCRLRYHQMQDRGCSPMSPSGMDDNNQDGLLASGEHTPMPFQSTFVSHTPSQAASAAPTNRIK